LYGAFRATLSFQGGRFIRDPQSPTRGWQATRSRVTAFAGGLVLACYGRTAGRDERSELSSSRPCEAMSKACVVKFILSAYLAHISVSRMPGSRGSGGFIERPGRGLAAGELGTGRCFVPRASAENYPNRQMLVHPLGRQATRAETPDKLLTSVQPHPLFVRNGTCCVT
jgi:hypothetical protein